MQQDRQRRRGHRPAVAVLAVAQRRLGAPAGSDVPSSDQDDGNGAVDVLDRVDLVLEGSQTVHARELDLVADARAGAQYVIPLRLGHHHLLRRQAQLAPGPAREPGRGHDYRPQRRGAGEAVALVAIDRRKGSRDVASMAARSRSVSLRPLSDAKPARSCSIAAAAYRSAGSSSLGIAAERRVDL